MRVISRKVLREFGAVGHADAELALRAWFEEAESADWQGPADIKKFYPSASILGKERVVFNIRGNRYRLVVAIKYEFRIVYIRFVGTHAEYDKINCLEV